MVLRDNNWVVDWVDWDVDPVDWAEDWLYWVEVGFIRVGASSVAGHLLRP